MDRDLLKCELLKNDYYSKVLIEPDKRFVNLKDEIIDIIKIYHPPILLKAGLGKGRLLLDIAEHSDYIVVVEPCFDIVKIFLEENASDKNIGKINFIIGNFENLPIDYFIADMIICCDYFDISETSASVDEFSRALQFEGIMIMGNVILHDDDLDGVFDELFRKINPLHNDYYLKQDLITMMELKKFTLVKDFNNHYNKNLNDIFSLVKKFSSLDEQGIKTFIDENKQPLKSFYGINDDYSYNEKYLISIFRKNKYTEDTGLDKK